MENRLLIKSTLCSFSGDGVWQPEVRGEDGEVIKERVKLVEGIDLSKGTPEYKVGRDTVTVKVGRETRVYPITPHAENFRGRS